MECTGKIGPDNENDLHRDQYEGELIDDSRSGCSVSNCYLCFGHLDIDLNTAIN